MLWAEGCSTCPQQYFLDASVPSTSWAFQQQLYSPANFSFALKLIINLQDKQKEHCRFFGFPISTCWQMQYVKGLGAENMISAIAEMPPEARVASDSGRKRKGIFFFPSGGFWQGSWANASGGRRLIFCKNFGNGFPWLSSQGWEKRAGPRLPSWLCN